MKKKPISWAWIHPVHTCTKRYKLPFRGNIRITIADKREPSFQRHIRNLLIVKPDLQRNLGKDEKLTRVSIWTKPAGNRVIVCVHTTRGDLRGCRWIDFEELYKSSESCWHKQGFSHLTISHPIVHKQSSLMSDLLFKWVKFKPIVSYRSHCIQNPREVSTWSIIKQAKLQTSMDDVQ